MTLQQVETLLKEASMEYIRTGANYEEVEYYAKMVVELSRKANNEFLNN